MTVDRGTPPINGPRRGLLAATVAVASVLLLVAGLAIRSSAVDGASPSADRAPAEPGSADRAAEPGAGHGAADRAAEPGAEPGSAGSGSAEAGVESGSADRATEPGVESGSGSGAAEPGIGTSYGVGRRDVTFVDPSRPTDAAPAEGIAAQPDRTLETVVLYPTVAAEAGPSTSDVRQVPAAAEGPFPLVMFSHGNGGSPDVYESLVEPVVRAGYVVALPTFPLTSLSGAFIGDAVNQPADVSFVIDQLVGLSGQPDGWLSDRIDVEHIAAAGHSLGAVTTVALTYDPCCIDPRIDAALAVSGIGVPSAAGALDDPPPTPLLLVHGVEDDVVPPTGSDDLFAGATGPAYYLRLTDGDHTSIGFGDDGELTEDVMQAFLDAELRDKPGPLEDLPADVEASGRGDWQENAAASP